MRAPLPTTSLLICAETLADAQQIQAMLPEEGLRSSFCVGEQAVDQAADAAQADLVLLGGQHLAHGLACLHTLYDGPRQVLRPYQRVLVLCSRSEAHEAFDLCMAGDADDYVQHWPIPLDGLRLQWGVHLLSRELAAARAQLPPMPVIEADAASPAPERGMAWQGQASTPGSAPIDRSKPWALLVDDDRFQYKVLRTVLAGTPLQVAWSASGADALMLVKQHRPHIILMDINMPDLDGIETVRQLRQQPNLAQVPIIMLTGNGDRERVVQSLAAGANNFMVKPLSRQRLLEVAAKLLPVMA